MSSGQTRQSLTELPQLLGNCVIPGLGVDTFQRAVGEVATTERFDSLLEGTVKSCLGSLDSVLEEKDHDGLHDYFRDKTSTPGQLSADRTCKMRWEMIG